MKNVKDDTIIELFFARSDNAVTALEDKYGVKMKNCADRYLPDRRDAEEVYNDTLVAIWNSIPPDHPNKLYAYLMKILKYKIIDKLKYISREKRNRTETLLFSDFDDASATVGADESAENTVISDADGVVDKFLETETALCRRLFLKRYYYGKTVSEIAKETGMSETAVASRISRTKSRLYEHLRRKGIMA